MYKTDIDKFFNWSIKFLNIFLHMYIYHVGIFMNCIRFLSVIDVLLLIFLIYPKPICIICKYSLNRNNARLQNIITTVKNSRHFNFDVTYDNLVDIFSALVIFCLHIFSTIIGTFVNFAIILLMYINREQFSMYLYILLISFYSFNQLKNSLLICKNIFRIGYFILT